MVSVQQVIPVFCKSIITGTHGRRKVNKYVISKEVYLKYAKPLKDKIGKSEDPNEIYFLKRMNEELFGEYIVEGAPLYEKLTKEKKDPAGKIVCQLVDIGPYIERL